MFEDPEFETVSPSRWTLELTQLFPEKRFHGHNGPWCSVLWLPSLVCSGPRGRAPIQHALEAEKIPWYGWHAFPSAFEATQLGTKRMSSLCTKFVVVEAVRE